MTAPRIFHLSGPRFVIVTGRKCNTLFRKNHGVALRIAPVIVFARGIAMDPKKKPGGAWSYMGVGSQMVAATFVGAGIGWWLDKLTGMSPLFLVIFFMLGSAAGFISVYRAFHNGEGPPS